MKGIPAKHDAAIPRSNGLIWPVLDCPVSNDQRRIAAARWNPDSPSRWRELLPTPAVIPPPRSPDSSEVDALLLSPRFKSVR